MNTVDKVVAVAKENIVKKCIEMVAEIAEEKKDGYRTLYERFGKSLKLGRHAVSRN